MRITSSGPKKKSIYWVERSSKDGVGAVECITDSQQAGNENRVPQSELSWLYGSNSVACVTLTQLTFWLSLISQTSSSDQESMFLGSRNEETSDEMS